MKNYIKNSAKILYNYAIVLIVFVIFIYVVMSITKDNFWRWLPLYSFTLFLFAFFIIYSDMKSLAMKEKKPQYDLDPYPFKGLVYGLIGVIPIVLVVAVASLIHLENETAEHIKHVAIKTFLGPLYFFIKWINNAPIGYIISILLLPVMSMLGYLAGFYNINITNKLKKKKVVQEKAFTRSPWNPSNVSGKSSANKKKKVKKDQGKQ